MNKMNKNLVIIFMVIASLLGLLLVSSYLSKDTKSTVVVKSLASKEGTVDNQSPVASTQTSEELLLYLIEEEKLAHDVYTVMYEKYGASVFGSILASETTHQNKVMSLLIARNIQDPRSSEIGIFKNTDLQALYNTLIAQGNKSVGDAYEVGTIIEKKDIADIGSQLATTSDADIVTTLESLRSGSENHLRAFNKQLSSLYQ